MANADITVTVERVIHDALRDFIQSTFDAHGILISNVQIDWITASSPVKDRAFVSTVEVTSRTLKSLT
jgi:hypothetical protein